MKLTSREKEIIEILRNISGETISKVDNVLKALAVYTILNHSENEVVTIPYFGTFKIKFIKDELNEDGKTFNTEVETFYSPSEDLKTNIGKLEDIKNNGGDFTSLPIIQDLKRSIDRQLRKELD